jgi:hypothetical protein
VLPAKYEIDALTARRCAHLVPRGLWPWLPQRVLTAMLQIPRLMLLALAVVVVLANVGPVAFTLGRSPASPPQSSPNGYPKMTLDGGPDHSQVAFYPVPQKLVMEDCIKPAQK